MNERSLKTNLLIVAVFLAVMMLFATSQASAVSVPSAKGLVNSSDGAILRKSTSTSSKKILKLSDNTEVKIYKEVFKSKSSTSKKKVWYYVKANGKKGYLRSDFVDNVSYGSVKGKLKAKLNYRKGPGVRMKKIGTYKKGTKIAIVLTANPTSSTKGSSKKWYKVQAGSKYYYVCSKNIKLTGKSASAGPGNSYEEAGCEYDRGTV